MMRLDHLQRPELNKGTVDFVVPEEYWASQPDPRISLPYVTTEPPATGARKPQPMDFVVLLDVSADSVRTGFLQSACESLFGVLYGIPNAEGEPVGVCFPPESRIAVITFDRAVHFYNMAVGKLSCTAERRC